MRAVGSYRIAPEWECYPVWVFTTGDPIPDNCSPERLVAEFGWPADLAAAIDAWDDEFQAVYDRNDPENSGFPDEATTAAWHGHGERLAGRLASEVSARRVPNRTRTACLRLSVDLARQDHTKPCQIPNLAPCGPWPLGRPSGRPTPSERSAERLTSRASSLRPRRATGRSRPRRPGVLDE